MDEIDKFANESIKTKRAREKIQKQVDDTNKKITGDALEKKVKEIQSYISRHARNRVVLKNKAFSLFDENRNAALESGKIASLSEQIKKAMELE